MILDEEPDVTVINLDVLTYAGNLANLEGYLDHPRHVFVKGDIRDGELIDRLISEHNIDGVINFAAESHVDRSIEGPEVFIDTNVRGTLVLLNAAKNHGLKRYLQVSTDEVYGSLGANGMFTESTPLSPNSPYSASKASADHLVHAFHHTYGMDTVTTRCSNNYGPFQFPEKMLPLMFNNAQQDKPLPVYGDGMQIRDWLLVNDHCRAIWLCYCKAASGSVYNIGGHNEQTNLEVIRQILEFLDKPETLITHVKDRPGHDRRYAIDASKIEKDLGWTPSVTFEEGLKQTLHWYLDHQSWVESVTSGDYQHYYEQMYANR